MTLPADPLQLAPDADAQSPTPDAQSPTPETPETPDERRERMRELGRKGGIARQAKAKAEREAAAARRAAHPHADLTDEELARSVLRDLATDGRASAQARAQAAGRLLGQDDATEPGALDPLAFRGVPDSWLRLLIVEQPADLPAAVALLVEHELAARLTLPQEA